MERVRKVMMFVYRIHNKEKQFFVLKRRSGDTVVLSGHIGDIVLDESPEEAVRREIMEELGVKPLRIKDLDYSTEVVLEKYPKVCEEHAFLVEIPDREVHFLEGPEPHEWLCFEDLPRALSYESQRNAVDKIYLFY